MTGRGTSAAPIGRNGLAPDRRRIRWDAAPVEGKDKRARFTLSNPGRTSALRVRPILLNGRARRNLTAFCGEARGPVVAGVKCA